MGKLFTPQDVSSGFNTTNSLNTNFDNIETALDRTLSRYGETPNAMEATLDMNDNPIINAGAIDCSSITIAGESIPSVADLAAEADRAETAAIAAELAETNAEAAQAAAEAAAASINIPTLAPGDAGKILEVNVTEDGYDLVAPRAVASQATAEAGSDNEDIMTALRVAQAAGFQIAAGDYAASDTQHGTFIQALTTRTANALAGGANTPEDALYAINAAGLSAASVLLATGSRFRFGDMLLQCGRVASTGTDTTITYPETFATVVFVIGIAEDTGNTSLGNSGSIGSTNTVTGFNLRHASGATHVNWLAIGTV